MNLLDAKILIVDDDFTIRKHLEVILNKNSFNTICCENGNQAIQILNNEKDINLIILDVVMDGMDGFQTARNIKKISNYKDIPIIFITGNNDVEDKKKGFEAGCVDYITKPFDNNEVLMRVKTHLELFYRREEALNYAKELEIKVMERTEEIYQTRKSLIISLSSLAETRDPETGAHIFRTQEYSKIIAIGLLEHNKYKNIVDDKFIDLIYNCSPLHDIGKVGIPDRILLKAGKLTEEEFNIMKSHCYIGKKTLDSALFLLKDNTFLKFAGDICYSHHEKYNGTGYPRRLAGDEIPLQGRIMAISDVYDALTTKRVYKDAWSHKDTIDFFINEKGKHFDPDLVDILIKNEKKFIDVFHKYHDDKDFINI